MGHDDNDRTASRRSATGARHDLEMMRLILPEGASPQQSFLGGRGTSPGWQQLVAKNVTAASIVTKALRITASLVGRANALRAKRESAVP